MSRFGFVLEIQITSRHDCKNFFDNSYHNHLLHQVIMTVDIVSNEDIKFIVIAI